MHHFFLKLSISLIFLGLLSCDSKKEVKTQKENSSNQVIIYNWKEYTSLDVLKKFEEETGIKVILKEFETVDEQIGTLQSNPYFCDLTVADTHIASSQYLPIKLISELDTSKLLNTDSYVDHFQEYKHLGIPYSFGITGYAIDTNKVKKDYQDYSFLSDPAFKGKICLLDDQFDIFLDLLVLINVDINAEVDEQSIKKLEKLANDIKNNQCDFNETFTNLDKLVDGEKWIVQTYSGDAASYMEDNPQIKFIFNKGSYNAWSEIICLTKNAPNKENAYKLLNFLSQAKNAAAFSNEFYYANGISGSEKFMTENVKSNPLINIPKETRNKGVFYLKSKESNSIMQKIFANISSAAKNETDEKED